MRVLSDSETHPEIKMIEIPGSVGEELSRLHCHVHSDSADLEVKKWAMDRIERIHAIFFCGAIVVGESKL